jgi:hypothetical protein
MNTLQILQTYDVTKPKIEIGNQHIELYNPTNGEEYLSTTNNNSNPISLQTSSNASEDEDFEGGADGSATPRPTGPASGGGCGKRLSTRESSTCYVPQLKRFNTFPTMDSSNNDMMSTPQNESLHDVMPLRIRALTDEKLEEFLMEGESKCNGGKLNEKDAHQKALNEMSPSFVFPETLSLKGPHYPKIRKSLSWSHRNDMSNEVIAQIKEFNKHSPVARV